MDIRPIKPAELDEYFRVMNQAFGGSTRPPADKRLERWRHLIDLDRTLAAFDEDALVGTAGTFAFTMTIPGGELPTSGVTMVAVIPPATRRGILSQMMTKMFDDALAKGEPLAILWASEGNIYQRFGYGMASVVHAMKLDRDRARFVVPSERTGRIRFVDVDAALKVLPEVYERVRTATPGALSRTEDWWRYQRVFDEEWARQHGEGEQFRAVWEKDGRAEGYVLYRLGERWQDDGTPDGKLRIEELISSSPEATRELWRYLFNVDLVRYISGWFQPVDDPVFLMLSEPRRARFMMHDGLWLRILDVKSALEARAYKRDGDITFALRDDRYEANDGTWTLRVSNGAGEVEKTNRDAEIELSIAELSSMYLGTFGAHDLAAAGRVVERVSGGLERADALFSWPVTPVTFEVF
jgi:predicted acetyltransferase